MVTPPWRIVTPAQLKEGWIEMRGVLPVHRVFAVIRRRDDGNYVVRNPELVMLEEEDAKPVRGRPAAPPEAE